VLLTHLHLDHIGWVVRDGEPYFPNATVRFGEKDLDQFVRTENPDFVAAPMIAALEARGLVDPITSDGEIAPGISTLHAPGHTLGHRCVVISSGDQRAFLLGDVIGCPVQIEEQEWGAMSDVDPKLAKRTRETLWKELEGTEDLVTAAHFSELQFGRILRGEGKRYFA
jgi:glyoxylase-like metal-dependent hydrolase (beta-lactamase superfamily II)